MKDGELPGIDAFYKPSVEEKRFSDSTIGQYMYRPKNLIRPKRKDPLIAVRDTKATTSRRNFTTKRSNERVTDASIEANKALARVKAKAPDETKRTTVPEKFKFEQNNSDVLFEKDNRLIWSKRAGGNETKRKKQTKRKRVSRSTKRVKRTNVDSA